MTRPSSSTAVVAVVERTLRRYSGPWRIDLIVRAGVPTVVPVARLATAVAAALPAAGASGPASIGLVLSHDRELAELNAAHLGHAGPTDVLSFPLLPADAFPEHRGGSRSNAASTWRSFRLPPGRRPHLGDIVVSVERAVEQAELGRGGQTGDVRWSSADELLLLVVHGTLHVCGWDHAEPVEEAAMRALESSILADIRAPDPAARRTG